jgi:acetyl-CoA carboxylase carboxyltransferase component
MIYMPIVTCGWTGEEMLIDEPGGVAYITHKDGLITCVARNEEEAIAHMEEMHPVEEVVEEVLEDVDAPVEEV